MSRPVPSGIAEMSAALGHEFADPQLLAEALTHPSAGARRRRPDGFGYERLEFLGDRVLGLVVAEMLLKAFPDEAEGALARRHAELVRRETLAAVAVELGLGGHVRLAPVEEPGARANPGLLADVCEALIAALYLDGGLEAAHRFVRRHWEPRMRATPTPPKDPKTALQEWAQARGLELPAYRLLGQEGPPHQPRFTVAVGVSGHPEASASGASKRLAESAAARALLERIGVP